MRRQDKLIPIFCSYFFKPSVTKLPGSFLCGYPPLFRNILCVKFGYMKIDSVFRRQATYKFFIPFTVLNSAKASLTGAARRGCPSCLRTPSGAPSSTATTGAAAR